MKRVLYLSLMVFAFASCKKDNTTVTPAGPSNPDSTKTTFSAKMTGNWIGIGWATGNSHNDPPDAFRQFSVLAVNDKTVVVDGHTLKYVSFDSSTKEVTYEYRDSYTYIEDLHFNPADNSMSLYWSSKYDVGDIITSNYKPNALLKNYVNDITGPKFLSGTAYDTFVMRHPMDSTYAINTTVTFTAINDSTLIFDKDFFDFERDTLRYKVTDEVSKTVVFQNFHSSEFQISTLTYNYATKSLVFEQQQRAIGWWKYLKIQ